jgi:isochorismate hydrolase
MELTHIKHPKLMIADIKKEFTSLSDEDCKNMLTQINNIALLIYEQAKNTHYQTQEYLQAA